MYLYELEKHEEKRNYDEICFPFPVSMPEQIIFDIYRQCKYILFILEEEFQDYKRVIRISNSKKGRQHNDQKKKTTYDDPQNTTQKTKDRATRTSIKNRCWTQLLRKGREICINSWHFDQIFYWVFTARYVSNHCLFRFAVHTSMCTRRQHTPSICVKQTCVGTSLCRQKITRGRLFH